MTTIVGRMIVVKYLYLKVLGMSQIIVKKFSKKLREERLSRNLSQETLAEKAKLSRNFIGMIERGERNVTISTLENISRALNVEPWELLRF